MVTKTDKIVDELNAKIAELTEANAAWAEKAAEDEKVIAGLTEAVAKLQAERDALEAKVAAVGVKAVTDTVHGTIDGLKLPIVQ